MKLNHFSIGTLFFVLILSACSNRPSWVLSEKKMTDVLYSIHLAEAEIEENYELYGNNPAKREELLTAVFKKHKITEAQFDTSLVWYNAHLESYFKICDEVVNRYAILSDTLSAQISKNDILLAEHNQTSIWNGVKGYELSPADPARTTITFHIDSIDSSPEDSYKLSFCVLGLNNDQPEVRFCLTTADTTIINESRIEKNGAFSSTLFPGNVKVKSISGSIHMPGYCPESRIVLYNFNVFQVKQATANSLPGSPRHRQPQL